MFGGHCGLGKPVSLLRGSKTTALREYSAHALFGRGCYKSDEYWKQLAEMLECAELLQRCRVAARQPGMFAYTTVQVSSGGNRWLAKRSNDDTTTLWLRPTDNMLRFMRRAKASGGNSEGAGNLTVLPLSSTAAVAMQQLRTKLLLCRSALATRHNVMPYMIASNRALEQLADRLPRDLTALREAAVDGLSEAKIVQFGAALVECIEQ